MCGIFCSVSKRAHLRPNKAVLDLLQRRGPDSLGGATSTYSAPVTPSGHDQICLSFVSTVLLLRGSQTVTQPYRDPEHSCILCWNGEAWSVGSNPTSGNDTAAMFDLLQSAVDSHEIRRHPTQELDFVIESLATVAGPYAFVFYSSVTGKLYFGRDFLGRRSLLYKVNGDQLTITSVSSGSSGDGDWTEIEADGVYCLDFQHQASLAESSSEETVQWRLYGLQTSIPNRNCI